MFYQKTIKDLRVERDKLTVKASEFYQKSCVDQYDRRLAEERTKELNNELEKSRSMGKILADENRDLVRQLELLRALLAQIQITVKLPIRKPNG